MSEPASLERSRKRRSRGEAERLVHEFECSGMTRVAFCRHHGLSATTLDNYASVVAQVGLQISMRCADGPWVIDKGILESKVAYTLKQRAQVRPRKLAILLSENHLDLFSNT